MTVALATSYVFFSNGVWKRRGIDKGGSVYTYGVDLPVNGVNCGLPGADPTTSPAGNTSANNTYTLTNGAVIEDKIIYGDISMPSTVTADIILRRCLLVGGNFVPATTKAVVICDDNRSGNFRLILEDCEIRPRLPALNRDGIRGNRWEMYRCYVHHTIDGIFAYAASNQNGGVADVIAKGNRVDTLVYQYPDWKNGVSGATWHTDGTHNDCSVLSGGANVLYEGNYFNANSVALAGSGTNPDKPWLITNDTEEGKGFANGASIIINEAAGTPVDSTTQVINNWMRGGLSQANLKGGPSGYIYTGNRHFHAGSLQPTGQSDPYRIRFEAASIPPVNGLNTGGGSTVTNTTNIWADNPNIGVALTTPRANGMSFDG